MILFEVDPVDLYMGNLMFYGPVDIRNHKTIHEAKHEYQSPNTHYDRPNDHQAAASAAPYISPSYGC